ncbi:RNA polymerase sigma factor [Aliiglaciecola sp. M165]|uniref:RNA polymerase sigma factor n=1 Tax=Aliiglaciecola sp. M165 TaxID=2593649 RepID=UPI00117D1F96|nr:DUF6596 domain-containing protein [Aliiglaciecola sp. M165]TRY30098.1 RNA polymerase subunit sigma-70 [Aliiglaciecola sp. M165]
MKFAESYRHHYGLLVANFSKRFGLVYLGIIEDAVQYSMEQSLSKWSRGVAPENQIGWLYRVAFRFILREIDKQKKERPFDVLDPTNEVLEQTKTDEIFLENELADSFLRMFFISCDKRIPAESQLVFTLKSLCGFETEALSIRLFVSKDNVYKRYQRAKAFLQQNYTDFDTLTTTDLNDRVTDVLNVLYLMFTEGYLSSHPDKAIRRDLCEEALRLTFVLVNNPIGNKPQCHALAALMLFNLARLTGRKSKSGLLLLEEQNRQLWDASYIQSGMYYLQLSAQGEQISRYHLEAGIAAEHCMSPSFAQTNWQAIIDAYELLDSVSPSPMHLINKAIAIAEHNGPEKALAMLEQSEPPSWLICSYYWYAVLADLHFRCKELTEAKSNASRALELATSPHVSALLRKRFNKYKS